MEIYEAYKCTDMMEYDKTKANLELFKDRHLNNRKRMCDVKIQLQRLRNL